MVTQFARAPSPALPSIVAILRSKQRIVTDPRPHETEDRNQGSRLDRSDLQYKIVESLEERVAAFRLVYQCYVNSGLIDANPYQLRVLPHHLLATTNVFVARRNDEIISTVSLIADGSLGLPIESVYPREVQDRRRRGLFVGEVSSLAAKNLPFKQFFPAFVGMTRLMAQFARSLGMDQLLVAVHPKHARLYSRLLGFEPIGAVRMYPSVRNRPALPCCLDFRHIDRDRPACWDQYFATRVPEAELQPRPMPVEERYYFRPATEVVGHCFSDAAAA